MKDIHQVLMSRDDLTYEEAEEIVNEIKERIDNGEDPDEILYEYGLEPDYFLDLY